MVAALEMALGLWECDSMPSAFKDYLRSDLDTFFNNDEVASRHRINGRLLDVIIDSDQLMERSKKEYDGISVGEILYRVPAEIYGERPEQGTIQIFDNRQYMVFDCREDEGVYEIILQQNRGR